MIYECVTGALNGTWDEASHDSAGAAENLPDLVAAVIAAVQSTVNEAYADFGQHWNNLNPDPIMRFPVELIGQCFQPLDDLQDCIAVSHVSRAWRRAALEERSLWTEAVLTPQLRNPATKLSVLLSRSHPLPFHLTWETQGDSRGELASIISLASQHIGRMEYLNIQSIPCADLQGIFRGPALLLQELLIRDDELDFFTIPSQWIACHAPRLWSLELELCMFAIPRDFEPLPSLQNFRGYLPAHSLQSIDPSDVGLPDLFHIFPGLVTLNLCNVTNDNVAFLGDVPPSVLDLTLECSLDQESVNLSSFVLKRLGHTVQRFRTEHADNVTTLIDIFASKVTGTWSMTVSGSDGDCVSLQADDTDVIYHLLYNRRDWIDPRHHPFMRCLDRLSVLTLPMRILAGFVNEKAAWDGQLPSLRVLSITHLTGVDCYVAGTLTSPGASYLRPVRATVLEELTISAGYYGSTRADEQSAAISVVCLLVSPECLQRATLSVQLHSAELVRNLDPSSLKHVAHCVKIKDGASGAILHEFINGERRIGPESTRRA